MEARVLEESIVVTTVRFERTQYEWLRARAEERARARGRIKADASEIIRELVAQAMSTERKPATEETWGDAVVRVICAAVDGGRLRVTLADASSPDGRPRAGQFWLSLPTETYRALVGSPRPEPAKVGAMFERFLEELGAAGQ